MERMTFPKGIDILAALLLALGGINWGLVGFFNINLVEVVFGAMSPASRVIYSLVGLASLYEVALWRNIQRRWECRLWPSSGEEADSPGRG
jgi:uncharacterized membrane protein YuzA (DUF378 family)